MTETPNIRPGMYNTEYFSGAQCAVYIGDVWVDEITSISYSVSQSKAPLYGYADTYFRDVAKGKVLVQGNFTINFKEAGYMFLILDRYKQLMNGQASVMNLEVGLNQSPWFDSSLAARETVESLVNNDGSMSIFERNRALTALGAEGLEVNPRSAEERTAAFASLGGFSDNGRAGGKSNTIAENYFEAFEDAIWQKSQSELDTESRRADDSRLSPFDIYVSFGDFVGDNTVNHTIQKLSDVYILGTAKEIIIDGQPVQESYSFIARNLV